MYFAQHAASVNSFESSRPCIVHSHAEAFAEYQQQGVHAKLGGGAERAGHKRLPCQLVGSRALACYSVVKGAEASGGRSRCGTGRAGAGCLGQCLYVSGVPGTGKTAAALEVVRALRRRAAAGASPAFRFVELNALRLPSPQHAYSALLEARPRGQPVA
jgi:Cdc6-like AAA superfamily ATPase